MVWKYTMEWKLSSLNGDILLFSTHVYFVSTQLVHKASLYSGNLLMVISTIMRTAHASKFIREILIVIVLKNVLCHVRTQISQQKWHFYMLGIISNFFLILGSGISFLEKIGDLIWHTANYTHKQKLTYFSKNVVIV